ncbi:MAG: cation-translocating P-type ATPase [Clostridia bacterium]|nr:cation-translocating P-type ATPase [Clostridia bacterium]
MKTASLLIDGMVCSACTVKLENTVESLDGVSSAGFSLAEGTATMLYDESKVSLKAIKDAIDKTGYRAYENNRENAEMLRARKENKLLRHSVFSFVFAVLATQNFSPLLQLLFASLVQFIGAGILYKDAINGLRCRTINMSFLVTLSSTCAYVYSAVMLYLKHYDQMYFDSSVMVITMVLVGKLIEQKTYGNASSIIENLISRIPTEADDLKVGDEVSLSGNRIVPADGKIIRGEGLFDMSILTGESEPVHCGVGDDVFAGTKMLSGDLVFEVTREQEETVYSNIVSCVRKAMTSKAEIQTLADKFVEKFCVIVLGIALLTGLVWFFLVKPWELFTALKNAMSVLVVACPCALGIATPLAVETGIKSAAARKVFFKGGSAIEALSKVSVFALDKTGTITFGIKDGEDKVRPLAMRTVEALTDLSDEVIMISGDKKEIAEAIGKKVGIDKVYAEVKPNDKAKIVEELRTDETCVAMVGDGFNDAPALAVADCGIAVGGYGDIAAEAADVVLLSGDISSLPFAAEASKHIMKIVRQNLTLSVVYNSIGIIAAMLGLLNPVIAGAAMSLSSVSVTLNAKRAGKL